MFTIIIATHERPDLLRRALRSLVEQTCQDFQVVVVADSGAHLPPYRELDQLAGKFTYVLRSGAPGPAESRNLGLRLADTPYLMFLDDDDRFAPEHLASLTRFIGERTPELIYTDYCICFEDRAKTPPALVQSPQAISLADYPIDQLYVRNRLVNSCVTYRSDLVRDLRHDPALSLNEDWDFLLAACRGRAAEHLPISSVVIHKTTSSGDANLRRGNQARPVAEVVEATLKIYRRHRAPTAALREDRVRLLASAGVQVDPSVL